MVLFSFIISSCDLFLAQSVSVTSPVNACLPLWLSCPAQSCTATSPVERKSETLTKRLLIIYVSRIKFAAFLKSLRNTGGCFVTCWSRVRIFLYTRPQLPGLALGVARIRDSE